MSADAHAQVLHSDVLHSFGVSLFWVTLLPSNGNDSSGVNQSISLSLPVREHTAISIYSKSQISDPFYLYSCYASSSWRLHLVLLSFFHLSPFLFSLLLLPLFLYLFKIPITQDCFSRSHAAVQPHGSNMFRDFSSPPPPPQHPHPHTNTPQKKKKVRSLFISATVVRNVTAKPASLSFFFFSVSSLLAHSPLLLRAQALEWCHQNTKQAPVK